MKVKAESYRNGKIPGRRGYNIDDDVLTSLFHSGIKIVEIAEKLDISQWTVLEHLKKLGLRRTKRHTIENPNVFSNTNVQSSCYWAGFLAADGFVLSGRNGIGIELSSVDDNQLKKLCHFVGRDNSLIYRTRHGRKYVSVNLISSKLMNDLSDNFNIVPQKSLVLDPPSLPKQMLRHFIRGYFDGDGCISWHKCQNQIRINFSSGSEKFLKWIYNTLCNEIGNLGHRTIVNRENSNVKTLDLSGNSAVRVLDWMYSDVGNATCLDRKYKRFLTYKERIKTISSIRKKNRQLVVKEMSDLYLSGMSYREVADRLNTTKEKVSYYLSKTDIPKRSRKTDSIKGNKIQQRDQDMLRKRESGTSVEVLSNEYGLAKSSIWIALKRAASQLEE